MGLRIKICPNIAVKYLLLLWCGLESMTFTSETVWDIDDDVF